MDFGQQRITVGVASLPYPGEAVSGDSWHIAWLENGCRVALIDGLGHGSAAAHAAAVAVAALERDPVLPAAAAVARCHEALIGTRGAAMLVAEIDVTARSISIAGMGNVEGRLWSNDRCQFVGTDRGIVGGPHLRTRPQTIAIDTDWLLVLHSDGVRNRFDLTAHIESSLNAQSVARSVLAEWSRETDDATVLVVRSALLRIDHV